MSKKILIGLIICIVVLSPAQSLSVSAQSQANPDFQTSVVRTLPDGLVIEFKFPKPVFETQNAGGNLCQATVLDGFGIDGQPGTPGIPVKGVMLGIPPAGEPE